MTIHKAKGLEFDLVVLTDLDRKLVARPPRVVVDRKSPLEPIRRILVHVQKDFQPLLPDDWQRVCGAAGDPVIREAIATLYVGLTRAAQGMEILVRPATEKERSIPKTLAGVIRSTLPETPEAPPDSVLWSLAHHADSALDALPDSGTKEPVPAEAGKPSTPTHPPVGGDPLAPIVLRPLPGGQRRRSRPRHTPSSAEGGRRISAADLLTPGSRTVRSVGTLLHAWIEQIGWDSQPPDDDTLRRIACREPSIADQVAELLGDFRAMCAAPAVAKILVEPAPSLPRKFCTTGIPAGPADPSLHREQPFALEDGDGTLLGIIDRLVVWSRSSRPIAAEVVDFKFDRMGASGREHARILAEKTAFYTPQLRAYRRAIAAIHDIDPARVSCDLVFMRTGEIVPIDG
jgi:ATP-dependent exoDNAse (exonuclease V) beta subunit